MKAVFGFLRHLWKTETFSPAGFLLRAIMITVLFCASELLGLREYTTFLSGTSGNVNLGWQTASVLGLIHLLLYVGFILLVPILLIAAGLLAGWSRWKGRSQAATQGLAPADEGRSNFRA
jgi:bacteriorhodopsin